MKLKAFATAEGISYGRMVRAAHAVGVKIGGSRKLGGTDITQKDMEKLRAFFAGKDVPKSAKGPSEDDQFEARRQGWLETYANAMAECKQDDQKFLTMLSIYGAVCMAKEREWLEAPIDGARVGDLAVELCYESGIDHTETHGWTGFTKYLIDQGFEAPGWGVI